MSTGQGEQSQMHVDMGAAAVLSAPMAAGALAPMVGDPGSARSLLIGAVAVLPAGAKALLAPAGTAHGV